MAATMSSNCERLGALDAVSRPALVLGRPSLSDVTETVCSIAERTPTWRYALPLLFTTSLLLLLVGSLADLVGVGIGEWGNNQSVAWAWDIAGFVFWIGIGHAGTLISAILLLLRQKWRTSINRAAEAMTLFAVAAAAIYPVFHVGRVWLAYWLFPLPNQMLVWPNWSSPLTWDVFAIGTYATVSLLFWYLGMVPDLAALRDRARSRPRQIVLGILSLGWHGSARHWHDYESAYLLLAGLSTPLVLSVHTIVSFDFAVSVLPGWHSTIFPPYFVAGAVLSGFAMVVVLMVLMRKRFGLQNLVTLRHFEYMNQVILGTSCMIGYAYGVEVFMAFYGGNPYEQATFLGRATGPFAWAYWTTVGCNVALPQLFWVKKIRRSPGAMVCIALAILVGMWLERFVIIVTSLHRAYLPSAWTSFAPTIVDISTFAGTVGLFLTLFLLFARYAPTVALSEVKALLLPDRPDSDATAEYGPLGPERGSRPLVAWFEAPSELLAACEALRKAGHTDFDAHTPFPVHGMSRAMGLESSKVPWIALGSGLVGAAFGIGLQFMTGNRAYPISIGAKPALPIPSWVPVAFETTVLFAAFGCFFGLWLVTRLPKLADAVLSHPSLAKASDDRFFVSLRGGSGTVALLEELGARGIEVLA